MFWIGGIDIVKMNILSKAIYTVNAFSKWPMAFFTVRSKHFYNVYRDPKDSKYSKQTWERKMELEELHSLTTKLQSSKHYGTGTKT